jgi:DNA polymerase-3 subunit alpha
MDMMWRNLMALTFTDLHLHTEYSLKDGMIRILDPDDPKGKRGELILNAETRNTGAVTATDHGNMYGQAALAYACKTFGLKHIPGCEFYIAPFGMPCVDKSYKQGDIYYTHLCGWAYNKEGYRNMCILQDIAYSKGFYYHPRIDFESIDKYGDGIIWSDACIGGILSSPILAGVPDIAYQIFLWMVNRFKDNYYLEVQDHSIPEEWTANAMKIQWANLHGVPIIFTTDAHYYNREDESAHRTLLAFQYGNWFDNPAFAGFTGKNYHLLSEQELIESCINTEWLNNTQLIVDKVEGGIITFGAITPPKFEVPYGFTDDYITAKEDAIAEAVICGGRYGFINENYRNVTGV